MTRASGAEPKTGKRELGVYADHRAKDQTSGKSEPAVKVQGGTRNRRDPTGSDQRLRDIKEAPDDRTAAFTEIDWPTRAKSILKAELKRRNWTYDDLAKAFRSVGIEESEANLRNKLSRGSFTAAFFLQTLALIGVSHVRLVDFPFSESVGFQRTLPGMYY